ncbi:MAG TPA: response regulator [Candidatus Cryosericum sp.]|nr:response regulator [Candidatus Cryosericum sp.]
MSTILVVEDDRATRHLIAGILKKAGYSVTPAADGAAAVRLARGKAFDLMLLDIWMPRMNGLEVLAQLRDAPSRPRVVVMTSDDTPETLLQAVREQAHQYLKKPVDPQSLVDLVKEVLAAKPVPPVIEVVSARPAWIEILVPCTREAAAHIHAFLEHLDTDLPQTVRESIGYAFRELLLNAIEWGGQLDPSRKVRIACLHARRMLLYRIADPGPGFRFEGLAHAAAGQPPDRPIAHVEEREKKGLRPGGFGIVSVRAMVDELIYNEAQNEVVFVKYLD